MLSSGPTRGVRPRQKDVSSVSVWHDLLATTAQFQTTFVVYVNRVGYEDGLNFGGGSIAVDPFGREVTALPALEPGLAVAELDAEVLRRARTAYPLLRDEKLELVRRELDRLRPGATTCRGRDGRRGGAHGAPGPARPVDGSTPRAR